MIKKTKPDSVVVNMGATVTVVRDGEEHHFGCSGTNAVTGHTPAQVYKNIKDCVENAIKGKGKKKPRK